MSKRTQFGHWDERKVVIKWLRKQSTTKHIRKQIASKGYPYVWNDYARNTRDRPPSYPAYVFWYSLTESVAFWQNLTVYDGLWYVEESQLNGRAGAKATKALRALAARVALEVRQRSDGSKVYVFRPPSGYHKW